MKDWRKVSEKRPPAKDHYSKVGVESNDHFTIVTGIIIAGATFLFLKYVNLRCMFTKICSNGIHRDIVTNGGIS